MEKSEEVVVVEVAPVVVVQSMADLLAEDAGAGLENLKSSDFAIPFITILQKGSPQVSRANGKYIKNAAPGMIMNTLTSEIFSGEATDDDPGGVVFIPCGFQKTLVRWKSRDSGGGLVCHYQEGHPDLKKFIKNERGQLVDPTTQDIIVDTAYHFGLVIHGESFPEFAVVSMYSTQLRKSRVWNTTMRKIVKKDSTNRMYNPPSYSHAYRLTTVGESRDSYDWYGWKIVIERELTNDDMDVYLMAREFAKQVRSGDIKVSAPPQDFDDSIATPAPAGDDVPF